MIVQKGSLEGFAAKIRELDGVVGKVGWFESAKYENGTPVAYVAAIQEFGNTVGTPIPPRPFMRPAVAEKRSEWEQIAARGAKDILAGQSDSVSVMKKITLSAQNAVSENIATLTEPPLSPITIGVRKYKKQGKKITARTIGEIARLLEEGKLDLSGVSTKPLEDTGLMSATLTSVVESANS
jgi:hypothetical protein